MSLIYKKLNNNQIAEIIMDCKDSSELETILLSIGLCRGTSPKRVYDKLLPLFKKMIDEQIGYQTFERLLKDRKHVRKVQRLQFTIDQTVDVIMQCSDATELTALLPTLFLGRGTNPQRVYKRLKPIYQKWIDEDIGFETFEKLLKNNRGT